MSVSTITTWLDKVPTYGLTLLKAGIIAVLGWILAYAISRIIARMIARSGNETLSKFLEQLIFYMLILFMLFAVLSILGVPTTSMLTILAGMSVAVGLSLRSSLSNLASGILLVIFKPFAIKDDITVDSVSGTVTDIELIFTYLKDAKGNSISVPNNKFMTNSITKTVKAAVSTTSSVEADASKGG